MVERPRNRMARRLSLWGVVEVPNTFSTVMICILFIYTAINQCNRTKPRLAFPRAKVCVKFRLSNIFDKPALSEALLNLGLSYPSRPPGARFMLAKAHHEVRPSKIQHGSKTLYENRTFFVRQNMKEP